MAALPEIGDLAGARVCVVGFTGQVGSAIVRVLVEANRTTLAADPIHVTGIARHCRPGVPAGVDAVYVDVARGVPAERFTHVVYAAGVTSDYRSRPRDVIESQLVGLEAMLERFDSRMHIRVRQQRTRLRPNAHRQTAVRGLGGARHTDASRQPLRLRKAPGGEPLPLASAERGDVRAIVARAGNLYGLDSPRSSTSVSELYGRQRPPGGSRSSGILRLYGTTAAQSTSPRGLCEPSCAGDPEARQHRLGRAPRQRKRSRRRSPRPSATSTSSLHPIRGRRRTSALTSSGRGGELGYAPELSIAEVLPAVATELQTGRERSITVGRGSARRNGRRRRDNRSAVRSPRRRCSRRTGGRTRRALE